MRESSTTFTDISSPVGERAAAGLARVAQALRHRAWDRAHAADLTPTQGAVLTFLDRKPGSTLSTVAEQLAVQAPTASEAVGVLVAKKLVRKDADPQDRRRKRLRLTAAGEMAAKEASLWPDFLAEVIEELDPAEQGALVRVLQKMIRRMQLRGDIPVTQMCASCRYFRPHRHPGSAEPHHCAFVDLPFGDRDLRFECPDHEAAEGEAAVAVWKTFQAGA